MRGNLDEGEPHGIPGTYLNSFYEQRPLPYAEAGYGYPEIGPDGRQRHRRQADPAARRRRAARRPVRRAPLARAGARPPRRHADPDARLGLAGRPAGPGPLTRLVSFVQRAVAAIEYVVEPVDAPARFVIQSELVANEELPRMKADPRVAAILDNPLVGVEHSRQDNGGILLHHTRASELSMAAGHGPPHRGPRPARGRGRRPRGLGPDDGRRAPQARRAAADRQAARLRLVEPALPAVAARPGRGRADAAPATPAARA